MNSVAPKWPWFERKFDFDFPAAKFPEIVVRISGTPLLVEHAISDVSETALRMQYEDTWSILENIGHLATLEPLWIGRVEDILGGQETMREADLTNQATFDAGFNRQETKTVMESFRFMRQTFLDMITKLMPDQWDKSSLHPRLKTPMRIVDLCFFVAEHDDYHLARIMELKSLLPEGV